MTAAGLTKENISQGLAHSFRVFSPLSSRRGLGWTQADTVLERELAVLHTLRPGILTLHSYPLKL